MTLMMQAFLSQKSQKQQLVLRTSLYKKQLITSMMIFMTKIQVVKINQVKKLYQLLSLPST